VTQPNLPTFTAIKIKFQPEVLHKSYYLPNKEKATEDKTGGRVARVEATKNILFFRNTGIKEIYLKK
jgi:hypothetical protein